MIKYQRSCRLFYWLWLYPSFPTKVMLSLDWHCLNLKKYCGNCFTYFDVICFSTFSWTCSIIQRVGVYRSPNGKTWTLRSFFIGCASFSNGSAIGTCGDCTAGTSSTSSLLAVISSRSILLCLICFSYWLLRNAGPIGPIVVLKLCERNTKDEVDLFVWMGDYLQYM